MDEEVDEKVWRENENFYAVCRTKTPLAPLAGSSLLSPLSFPPHTINKPNHILLALVNTFFYFVLFLFAFCWITTVVDRFFWFVVVVQYSCLLAIREKDEEEKWNWRPIRQQKISIRFLLLLLRHTYLLSLFLIFKKRNIDRIVFQWWIYDFDDDLIWWLEINRMTIIVIRYNKYHVL